MAGAGPAVRAGARAAPSLECLMKETWRSGHGRAPILWVVCCAVLLAACPRSPPGGGKPDAGVAECESTNDTCIALGDWCEALATADCQRRVRCGFLEESKVPECVRRQVNACPRTQYEHGVRTGRLAYSATRARECVAGHEDTACLVTPPTCEGIFEGRSGPGEACELGLDCAAGSFCRVVGGVCPGTCMAYRSVGEACDEVDPCEPSARCDYEPSVGHGVCRPRAGLGELCSCPLHRQDLQCGCQLDLLCNAPPLSSGGNCVKMYAGIGEPCGSLNSACTPDAYCSEGTCQPIRKKGESCSSDDACVGQNWRTPGGLRCINGTCVEQGNEGGDCAAGCKQELFCEDSRCRAFPGEGQPCAPVRPYCNSQSICEATSGSCIRLPEAEAPCLP